MTWFGISIFCGGGVSILLLGFHFEKTNEYGGKIDWIDRDSFLHLKPEWNDLHRHPWSVLLASILNSFIVYHVWPDLLASDPSRYDGTNLLVLLVHLPATMTAHGVVLLLARNRRGSS